MDMQQQAIGSKIRAIRVRLALKQHDVADAINMSRSNYQKIESGKIGVSVVTAAKLSQLFKLDSGSFLQEITTESSSHVSDSPLKYQSMNSDDQLKIKVLEDKVSLLEKSLEDKEQIILLLREKLAKFESNN